MISYKHNNIIIPPYFIFVVNEEIK